MAGSEEIFEFGGDSGSQKQDGESNSILQLRDQLNQKNHDLKKARQQHEELSALFYEAEERISQLNDTLKQSSDQNNHLLEKINNREFEIEECEKIIRSLRLSEQQSQEKLNKLQEQADNSSNSVVITQSYRDQLENEIQRLKSEADKAHMELDRLINSYEEKLRLAVEGKSSCQQLIEELESEKMYLREEVNQLHSKLEELEGLRNEGKHELLSDFNDKLDEQKILLECAHKNLREREEEISSLHSQITNFRESQRLINEEQATALKQLEEEKLKKDKIIEEQKQLNNQLESEIGSLKLKTKQLQQEHDTEMQNLKNLITSKEDEYSLRINTANEAKAKIENQLVQSNHEIIKLKSDVDALEEKLKSALAQVVSISEMKNRMEMENSKLNVNCNMYKTQNDLYVKKCEESEEKYECLQSESSATIAELSKNKNELLGREKSLLTQIEENKKFYEKTIQYKEEVVERNKYLELENDKLNNKLNQITELLNQKCAAFGMLSESHEVLGNKHSRTHAELELMLQENSKLSSKLEYDRKLAKEELDLCVQEKNRINTQLLKLTSEHELSKKQYDAEARACIKAGEEKSLISKEYNELRMLNNELKSELQLLRKNHETVETDLKRKDKECENLHEENIVLKKKNESVKTNHATKLADLNLVLKQKNEELEALNKTLKLREEKIEEQSDEIETHTATIYYMRHEISDAEAKIAELTNKNEAHKVYDSKADVDNPQNFTSIEKTRWSEMEMHFLATISSFQEKFCVKTTALCDTIESVENRVKHLNTVVVNSVQDMVNKWLPIYDLVENNIPLSEHTRFDRDIEREHLNSCLEELKKTNIKIESILNSSNVCPETVSKTMHALQVLTKSIVSTVSEHLSRVRLFEEPRNITKCCSNSSFVTLLSELDKMLQSFHADHLSKQNEIKILNIKVANLESEMRGQRLKIDQNEAFSVKLLDMDSTRKTRNSSLSSAHKTGTDSTSITSIFRSGNCSALASAMEQEEDCVESSSFANTASYNLRSGRKSKLSAEIGNERKRLSTVPSLPVLKTAGDNDDEEIDTHVNSISDIEGILGSPITPQKRQNDTGGTTRNGSKLSRKKSSRTKEKTNSRWSKLTTPSFKKRKSPRASAFSITKKLQKLTPGRKKRENLSSE